MSTGVEAMKMPLNPPIVNSITKPTANSIGVVNLIAPPHIVAIQLNTLMADGTAMISVVIMKLMPSAGFIPDWNMWWHQTMNPRKAMAMMANTMAWYPKIGFLAPLLITSDTIPNAGRIRM